jgi:glycosyltransferase involved in cell wall biosynthesis
VALRILHLINSLHPREGGTAECVRQLGGAMAAAGHFAAVAVCADAPGEAWLEGFPIEVHAFGPALGRFAFTPRLGPWLRRNGAGYDAWIVHGLWQYQGFGATRIARSMGIPYFVYAHGALDPWQKPLKPFKHVKKLAYWLLTERSRLANAAGVVFTVEEERRSARSCFPFSRFHDVVAGLGIAEPAPVPEGDACSFRALHGIAKERDLLLFLGRVHPKKAIDRLLRALASLPGGDARPVLAIAGPGEAAYVESLRALVRDLRIEGLVMWIGPVYGDEKWRALRAADLFVLPSRHENFGFAVVEALAMGLPACTSRGVNIHRVVERHGAGMACGDAPEEIAAALARWSAMGEAARRALRENARRCYEAEFRAAPACDRLIAALREALPESRRARAIAAA